ncbi:MULTISPECIES: hypothetical protein [unclassified Sinorhizobium]|uniref:hypothetical protein n=1 Tax=unclassified Sinorhizobium TaxID=2613772 RepID=UPI0035238B91
MKVVLFFLTLAGSGWGIWWKIDGRIKESDKAAEARIKAAEDKADKALAGLSAHQVHAAETFATKAGMHDQTAQLLRAIEAIGTRLDSRLDSMSERLDRFVENQPARRSTRG